MEQETKTEGIESNTGETNTKRSRRRQTEKCASFDLNLCKGSWES